LTNRSK